MSRSSPSPSEEPRSETAPASVEGLREALEPLIDEVYQRGLDAPEAAEYMAAALQGSEVRGSEEGLDAAWREVEAALPEGWFIESIRRDWHHRPPRWWVRRFRSVQNSNTITMDGPDGDSPAAALRAFAARLLEGAKPSNDASDG
jgi:hypothetical protein